MVRQFYVTDDSHRYYLNGKRTMQRKQTNDQYVYVELDGEYEKMPGVFYQYMNTHITTASQIMHEYTIPKNEVLSFLERLKYHISHYIVTMTVKLSSEERMRQKAKRQEISELLKTLNQRVLSQEERTIVEEELERRLHQKENVNPYEWLLEEKEIHDQMVLLQEAVERGDTRITNDLLTKDDYEDWVARPHWTSRITRLAKRFHGLYTKFGGETINEDDSYVYIRGDNLGQTKIDVRFNKEPDVTSLSCETFARTTAKTLKSRTYSLAGELASGIATLFGLQSKHRQ
ncbi:hypothetical protein [Geomicrobium sp. JCM 19055]|uniref:hypothetical protein n=1 Tax=Geomicrobium sp. JCM 19055 TaxID=1460649 RepID=UPI00045ED686|nr:hypothetical protein [Geomicrobium sp. JCM 19055]GAK01604.1 hypothetical protein JCM19055_4784 [Geomicrobium sp. JCM 19055]